MLQPRSGLVQVTRLRVIIAFLAVVAVALWARQSGAPATSRGAMSVPRTDQDASPAGGAGTRARAWSFETARDPFRAPVIEAPALPPPPPPPPPVVEPIRPPVVEEPLRLKLTSVVSGQGSYAVIDGRVLHLGDSIAGYRIVEIRGRSVVLEKDGVRRELRP